MISRDLLFNRNPLFFEKKAPMVLQGSLQKLFTLNSFRYPIGFVISGLFVGHSLGSRSVQALCNGDFVKELRAQNRTRVGNFEPNGVNTTLHVGTVATLYPETKTVSIAISASSGTVKVGMSTWTWNGSIKVVCKLIDERDNVLKAFTLHLSHTGTDEQVFENVDESVLEKAKSIVCSIHT